jgi:hypothetical protein
MARWCSEVTPDAAGGWHRRGRGEGEQERRHDWGRRTCNGVWDRSHDQWNTGPVAH